MGKPSVSEAVAFLTQRGIRADRGYPNGLIPRAIGLCYAVVVHKVEPTAVTYKTIVCAPKKLGLSNCENGASIVATVWSEHGAVCSWGNGSYDENMGMFTVCVYGRWEDPPAEE